jgi:hypothetical protein
MGQIEMWTACGPVLSQWARGWDAFLDPLDTTNIARVRSVWDRLGTGLIQVNNMLKMIDVFGSAPIGGSKVEAKRTAMEVDRLQATLRTHRLTMEARANIRAKLDVANMKLTQPVRSLVSTRGALVLTVWVGLRCHCQVHIVSESWPGAGRCGVLQKGARGSFS